jgi:hypothetical protein
MFEKILEQYCNHFNVGGIPTHLLLGVTDEELIEMMKKAIEKNEPIKVEYDPNCDY